MYNHNLTLESQHTCFLRLVHLCLPGALLALAQNNRTNAIMCLHDTLSNETDLVAT